MYIWRLAAVAGFVLGPLAAGRCCGWHVCTSGSWLLLRGWCSYLWSRAPATAAGVVFVSMVAGRCCGLCVIPLAAGCYWRGCVRTTGRRPAFRRLCSCLWQLNALTVVFYVPLAAGNCCGGCVRTSGSWPPLRGLCRREARFGACRGGSWSSPARESRRLRDSGQLRLTHVCCRPDLRGRGGKGVWVVRKEC